jgi:pilus assembly protein CpaE
VVDLLTSGDELGREDLDKILAARPRLIFLDLGDSPAGVGSIQTLGQEAADVPLVVAGPALSAEGLLSVMRAGAAEYLPRPVSAKETSEAFARVRRRVKPSSSDSPTAPGKVVTVFSAKGGTGVTTVATNLAVAIRMLTNKETLVLDPAPTLGTASVAMGLQARYSYLDVIQNFHRIDEELFRSFLEIHDSGVNLLASPAGPTGMDPPTDTDLHGLLGLCKQHFDYVVVDGGNTVSENLLTLLQESDERILVVTPELASLRNLKQALDLYGRVNSKAPPKVVLNQFRENFGLSRSDVEDGLGQRVSAVLEKDDERLVQSVNLGRPEVQSGKSRFARSVMRLGSEIAGTDSVVVPRKGLFGRLFRSSKSAGKPAKEAS